MKYHLLPHSYSDMSLNPGIGRQISSDTDMLKKCINLGSLGGSVVKNPHANAGNTGSIPDPGESHMLWSK